jgi:hypothetical protein
MLSFFEFLLAGSLFIFGGGLLLRELLGGFGWLILES